MVLGHNPISDTSTCACSTFPSKQLIPAMCSDLPSFPPSHESRIHIEICIPDELQYFLSETAEDLEITTDELVRQAISSYCREQQGGHHE